MVLLDVGTTEKKRRPGENSRNLRCHKRPSHHTYSPKYYLPLLAVFLIAFVGIGKILIEYTDSDVPWWDSFTTALSIVGMWMLARKHIEQWLTWILVDIVSCGLYIYKEIYFTSALYGIYAIVAIFGYMKWKELMASGQCSLNKA